MKNKLALLIASIAFLNADTYAATVTWGDINDTALIDAGGALLTQGNYVRIGYFGTLSNSQIQTDAQTTAGIALLNADFHEFATTKIGQGTGTDGLFSINSTPTYASLTGFSPNSQIYFWALDATNNTSLTTALSSITQTAIGYVPFANNGQWQFPASDIAPAKGIDLSDLSNANRVVLAGTYVSGTTASVTAVLGSPNHALQLSSVTAAPEPSRVMLLGLSVLGLIWRRRR
ncbi:MAG: hypothetical protein JWR15_1222 [Prosthecobacter sp.]|nr:hypothetical protein [Prosthecobacter sp.]